MPNPEEPVWVVEQATGRVGTVPFGELESARQSGYSVATNDELAAHQQAKATKRAATEGFVNKANTVVEAVARAATLGGVDYLAAKLTPEVTESVKARKDTALGKGVELAADVALVLGTGGTAGALKAGATGAKLGAAAAETVLSKAANAATKAALTRTPLGAVAEGGAALRQGVQRGTQAMLGDSAVARAAGSTLGHAAEGGALGAVTQMADNVSEASLGKEELTAERLLIGTLKGAAFGAGGGAALPAAAATAKLAARTGAKLGGKALLGIAASKPVEHLASVMPGSLGTGLRAANTLGKIAGDTDGTILSKLGRAVGDEDSAKFFGTGSVRSDYARRDKVLDELADELAPKIERVAAIQAERRGVTTVAADIDQIAQQVKRGPEVWSNAQDELAGLSRDLQEMTTLKGMKVGTGASVKRALKDLSATVQDSTDEAALFVALDKMRGNFAKIAAKGGTVEAESSAAVTARIDDLLQNEDVWGNAARMQRERMAAAAGADETRVLSTLTQDGAAKPAQLRGYLAQLAPGDDFSKTLVAELDREAVALQRAAETGPTAARATAAERLREVREIQGQVAERFARTGDMNDLHAAVLQEARERIPGAQLAGTLVSGVVGGPVAAAAHWALSSLSSPATLASRIGTIENLSRQVRASELATNAAVERIVRFGREAKEGAEAMAQRAAQAANTQPGKLRMTLARAPAAVATVAARSNAETERKSVERKMKLLKKAAEDPSLIMTQAQRLTDGMVDAAPGVTTAVIGKYTNAIQHLQAKTPVIPVAGGVQVNAHGEHPIPDSAIRSMHRRIDAATDPNTVVKQLENGEIHSDTLETARAVWPEHMSDINMRLIARLANDVQPSSYQQLLRLSAVTSAPLAATMSPKFIAAQQGMHDERAAKMAQMQQQGSPPPKRTPDVAKTVATSSEELVANLQGGPR